MKTYLQRSLPEDCQAMIESPGAEGAGEVEGGIILSADTQTSCSGKPFTILSDSADEHEHANAIVTTAIEKHFKTAFIGLIGFSLINVVYSPLSIPSG